MRSRTTVSSCCASCRLSWRSCQGCSLPGRRPLPPPSWLFLGVLLDHPGEVDPADGRQPLSSLLVSLLRWVGLDQEWGEGKGMGREGRKAGLRRVVLLPASSMAPRRLMGSLSRSSRRSSSWRLPSAAPRSLIDGEGSERAKGLIDWADDAWGARRTRGPRAASG
ncbi:hypothetical protein ZWY2020_041468 [Hordeum vulgare]|nr:hypothetical protein ZWY2020_041468 [Hordeum vulgare]